MSYRYTSIEIGSKKKGCGSFVAFVMIVLLTTPAQAIQVSATFNDPDGEYKQYYGLLEANLAGAAATWGAHLVVHPDAVIDIEFSFDNIPTAASTPRGHSLVGTLPPSDGIESVEIWEPEIALEIRTGEEIRPGMADGKITIGRDYLQNQFWYDPDPLDRTAPVPDGKVDAVSTLTHELGHILGFTGWHNDETGELGVVASPYDALIAVPEDGNLLYFSGKQATGAYGGLVPLTEDNTSHIGNRSGLPGDDLLDNLMNGVIGRLGARRWPQPMDFAILADLGYEVTLPTWLEGDHNADGVVNAADYTVWRDNMGATGMGIPGDGNLDHVVNNIDLALWQDDFGFQFFTGGGTPLPEPTSGFIFFGLLMGLASFSRRSAAGSTGWPLGLPV